MYKGARFSVYALIRDNKTESLNFLDSIDAESEGGRAGVSGGGVDQRIKARYLQHISSYADQGQLKGKFGHRMDPAKPPGEAARGLFGFKDIQSQTRILAFQSQHGWVLTHGFGGKKENEFPVSEINKANAERNWFQQQIAALGAKGAKANQGGRK